MTADEFATKIVHGAGHAKLMICSSLCFQTLIPPELTASLAQILRAPLQGQLYLSRFIFAVSSIGVDFAIMSHLKVCSQCSVVNLWFIKNRCYLCIVIRVQGNTGSKCSVRTERSTPKKCSMFCSDRTLKNVPILFLGTFTNNGK